MPVQAIQARPVEHMHHLEEPATRREHSDSATFASRPVFLGDMRGEKAPPSIGASRASSPWNISDESRIEEDLRNLRRWLEATKIGHGDTTYRHPELLSPTDSGPHTPPDSTLPQTIQVKGKAKELDEVVVPRLMLHDATEPKALPSPTVRFQELPEVTVSVTDNPAEEYAEDEELAEDVQVLPSLTASDIHCTVEDSQQDPPSLKQLRERIIKQYPQLVSAPEPVVKPRKAHEPPPAVDPAVRARFKQTSKAEKDAREQSLILNVDEERELSVIRGIVILESRQGRWEKVVDQEPSCFVVPELAELPSLPSAWLLPIDTARHSAQHKIKSKKTFELPDYRVVVPCWDCHGEKSISCHACAGVAADECFWCDGSGIRRGKPCDGCGGHRVHECRTCSSRGRLACTQCDSTGKVHATYVVDVKLRTIELPPIRIENMVGSHMPGPLPSPEEIMQCARAKMALSISRLFEEQSVKPVPAVPVLARCIWSKTVQRVVSVWRPYHIPKAILRRLQSAEKLGKATLPPSDENEVSSIPIEELVGSDGAGELRRFIVPCDPSAPVVELQHDARARSSPAHSRRTSTIDVTSSASSPLPSPSRSSFSHVGNFWRNSVARARSGSLISPAELTPMSTVPPSSASSTNGSGLSVESTNASPRPSMARLPTSSTASSSMPPSPLRLSHDSGVTVNANGSISPIKRLRRSSIADLVTRRRAKSASDVVASSSSSSGTGHGSGSAAGILRPAPLTPAGPVTWSRRQSSAVSSSSLLAA